ncbi:hypothetical protein H8S56_01060 [Pseudomonas sp. DOAB1067]|uniref:Uncharacterized protein n=1 Tax=Pseudomonas triticifolii TaxID=2762592 RepID=A0ABR7B8U0_9PSED|nr:hypothetical protein [Pseudomonas triticifolii]MBC3953596.1 hypothetical protein [Pseudomonas triticifolii]
MLIFNLQTVILGEADAKAKAKFEEYKRSAPLTTDKTPKWIGSELFKPYEPLQR